LNRSKNDYSAGVNVGQKREKKQDRVQCPER